MIRQAALSLFLATASSVLAQQPAEDPAALFQRANAAYDAGRYDEAASTFERVVALLPRSTGARIYLARALARQGKATEAIALLQWVVDYGVRFNAEDQAWTSIRQTREFKTVESRMHARTAPLLRSETAFLLEKDLIPENIVYDPATRSFFVGSMYKAKIIRIAPDGTISDFVPSRRDGLLSVLGMKIDPERRELWATAGNFGNRPPMEVDDPATRGQGALFRFSLTDGRLIRKYPAPGGSAESPMSFNDLVIAPNGDVFATGGTAIWRVRSGGEVAERFVEVPGAFFNGITIAPDGKTLFGASHFQGVVRIDVATKAHTVVGVPHGVTLGGIDGLYLHEGSLIGVQNGTDPIRVVRAWLDLEMKRVVRFEVLEQGHPLSDIPLTGTIVGNDLYYVARSQLRAFDDMRIWPMEKLKETVILKLPLEVPAPPPVDLEKERQALLELHRAGIRAHIELNANALADRIDDEMISASAGKISRRGKDDVRKMFTGYFNGATYHEYVDLEPPVIRISDDGSMAWMLTRLRVRRSQNGQEQGFVYAGMMTYEKRDGKWVTVGNASTFEP
jgi:ketosteroid isomerase-like protein